VGRAGSDNCTIHPENAVVYGDVAAVDDNKDVPRIRLRDRAPGSGVGLLIIFIHRKIR